MSEHHEPHHKAAKGARPDPGVGNLATDPEHAHAPHHVASTKLSPTVTFPPAIRDIAGVWRRLTLHEPPTVCLDDSTRDGTVILWGQDASGRFIDVRCEANGRVRGFAGTIQVTPASEEEVKALALANKGSTEAPTAPVALAPCGQAHPPAFRILWNRALDTMPECCPSGVDTALCTLTADPFDGAAVLREEGDGYIELWRRVVAFAPGESVWRWVEDGGVLQEAALSFGSARLAVSKRAGKMLCWVRTCDGRGASNTTETFDPSEAA